MHEVKGNPFFINIREGNDFVNLKNFKSLNVNYITKIFFFFGLN